MKGWVNLISLIFWIFIYKRGNYVGGRPNIYSSSLNFWKFPVTVGILKFPQFHTQNLSHLIFLSEFMETFPGNFCTSWNPFWNFQNFWSSGNCTYSHITPFVYQNSTCYGDGEYLLMAWRFFLIITSVNLLMIFSLAISHMNTPFFAVAPHIQLTSPANCQN